MTARWVPVCLATALAGCSVLFADGQEPVGEDALRTGAPDASIFVDAPSMQDAGPTSDVGDEGSERDAQDGEQPVDAAPRVWGDEPGYVFLTFEGKNGRLSGTGATGVQRGDALCQQQAGLRDILKARKFRAYLSDENTDARARGFFNPAGWRFVPTNGAAPEAAFSTNPFLWNGDLPNGLAGTLIDRSQYGTTPPPEPDIGLTIWTGSYRDGTRADHCKNWDKDGTATINTADAHHTGVSMTNPNDSGNCGAIRHVLCIEVP